MTFNENSNQIIEIHIEELTPSEIPVNTWEDWFKTWLNHLSSYLQEAPSYELSLRLTDDAEIQELNANYRQKDQPTDVLAFAALDVDFPNPNADVEPLYLGDLVISVETAIRQAEQQNHSLTKELAWLAAHGLLHLLGWDHPDDESLEAMLAQQDQLLQQISIIA